MQLLPDYCAVNVLLGGSLADQSRVRRKKKLFDFLFQTICEKVQPHIAREGDYGVTQDD